jgi:hypothetical protein
MNRKRKGIRSTTKSTSDEIIEADFRPPIDEKAEVELFIGATIADQNDGTIYTDNTGRFPVQSFHGKQIQFVAYEYRSNAIIVKTLRDQTDKSMVEAFQEVYEYLTTKGFKPKLNVMDNQCSKAVQTYIHSTGADIQLVNPDDHRVNAAERAIQTWKNHWIAGMGTLDPKCPMQLWCQFIEQGQDTLNMLRVSRINPKLSAYAVLEGQFNFDKTPLAPVGTKALVFLDPAKRNTWQSHAIDAWYVGPAKKHYRNYRFFIPDTKGYRISASAKFFPAHCKMPAIEPGDTIRLAAQDLITAMQTLSNAPIDLNPKHTQALRKLTEIFNEAARIDNADKENNPPPRVNTQPARVNHPAPRVQPSTSHDPTSPKVLATQPRVHQRVTRQNTPMPTIFEETPRSLQRIRTRENKPNPQPIRKQ